MIKGYKDNIERVTLENGSFRRVLYTGKYSQLVAMSLRPGEEIGLEVHEDTDQFFRIDAGEGKIIINGMEQQLSDGDAAIVPAGAEHNVINTSATEDLKLYTIYSPSHHRDGTVHETREQAMADDEHFDGKTTE